MKGRYDLGIHDDEIFHDEVGNERADELPVVVDIELALALATETLFRELNEQGAFVEFFVKPGLEDEEHLVGSTDDFFGEFVEFHMRSF